ncbi:MAG: J domain-containing protein [Chlamydiales bacterium]|nr:J domain-containing protein [Chlamydiales bacterium]
MSISLPAKTSKVFHYQMLPSVFQLAEAPTYIAWQALQSSEKLWNQESANSSHRFINRTLAILSGVGGYVGGMIALPITLACTPVTIVADVVIGIAECSFCYYHGLSGNDIKKIAHRKFVISPLQQFIFCSAAISAIVIANVIFSGGYLLTLSNPLAHSLSSIFWTFGYAAGQVSVGKLPSNLNHQSFNIFINGGSGETEGGKWVDGDNTPPGESFNDHDERVLGWESYIAEELCHLSSIDDARVHEKYIAFKKGVFEQKTPRELLSLNIGFSQEELRKSYKTLALIIHPDRNASSIESESLFKILNQAYNRLYRDI